MMKSLKKATALLTLAGVVMASGSAFAMPRGHLHSVRSKLGNGGYNLALNNCEHFAVWCKTGVKNFSQVNHILDVITYFLS